MAKQKEPPSELANEAVRLISAKLDRHDVNTKGDVYVNLEFCGIMIQFERHNLDVVTKTWVIEPYRYGRSEGVGIGTDAGNGVSTEVGAKGIAFSKEIKTSYRDSLGLCSREAVAVAFDRALYELHRKHWVERMWRECLAEGNLPPERRAAGQPRNLDATDIRTAKAFLTGDMLPDWELHWDIVMARAPAGWL